MTRLFRLTRILAAGCACSIAASGCITISPGGPTSLKALTGSKSDKVKYEEKIEAAPKDPQHPEELKLAYAKMMEDSGQFVEAHQQYSAVLEIQPNHVDAILGLARLDQLAGNLEQSEAGFRKAVKLAPTSAVAQASLGQFLASQQQWDSAAQALSCAILADPYNTKIRFALAVALAHHGDIEAALPHFYRTVGDAEAHYNVGLILQEDGNLDQAEQQFSQALAMRPELTEAREWLVHLQSQRVESRSAAPISTRPPVSRVVPAGHSVSSVSAPQPAAGRDVAPPPPPKHLTARQWEQLQNQVSSTAR